MTTASWPATDPNDRSFESEIARQMGTICSNLETIIDRNPDAAPALRAALARVIGKCIPLTEVEHLKRLRAACEPPTVAVEVRFTEVDRIAEVAR